MDIISRLTEYYRNQEPKLSFGSCEGTSLTTVVYPKWPEEKAQEHLGIPVWRGQIKSSPDSPVPAGYCVVDAYLDVQGHGNPEALPLPSQMLGHELLILIYVDKYNSIRMRTIGGFTGHPEANRL
jgi:hypothetical protein